MWVLYAGTGAVILISLIVDPSRTAEAFREGFQTFKEIIPALLFMLIIISFVLTLFPREAIVHYLGGRNLLNGAILAAVIGSISIIPGFIAFPLAGILLLKGVPYTVIAAFLTTLMLVGTVTYPMEAEYFGHRFALLRNLACLLIALLTSMGIGIVFGEIL